MKKILYLFALSLWLFIGCANDHQYDEMNDAAMQFATDFFNFRYEQSLKQCTTESEKWLRFAASNVSSDDLEAINGRSKEASCSVKDARFANDTTGFVTLSVHDCLVADSLGLPMRSISAGTTTLEMKAKNGSWKVSLTSLPRVKSHE